MFDSAKKKVAVLATGISTFMPVAVYAESNTGTANTDIVAGMTTAANDMIATGKALVPIAIGVIGLVLAVRFGIKFFKQIAK